MGTIHFFRLAGLFLLTVFFALTSAAQSTLHVTIDKIRNSKGVCCLLVFSDGLGFPGDRAHAVRVAKVKAVKGAVNVVFNDLAPGTYAIAVVHDENEDGNLNTNFLGIPKEGYGATNNKLPFASVPRFSESHFDVRGASESQTVHLRYL